MWLDDQQRRIVRLVAGEIEALRNKRQAQWHHQQHPQHKRWTQEELCDVAYPSYKNLLQGRTLHLPTRPQLIHIAAYLECTIHEMNDLLLAAQYMPEQIELREDQYQAALEQAKQLLYSLPFPAQLVERGNVVVAMNNAFLELLNIDNVLRVPAQQRSLANWFFDHRSPYYHIHTINDAIWHENARTAVAFYRAALQPFRYEPWFRCLEQEARKLPHFTTFWDDPTSPWEVSDVMCSIYPHVQPTLMYEHNLVVRMSAGVFPHVIIRTPADETAHYIYQRAGFISGGDGWQQLVRELHSGVA